MNSPRNQIRLCLQKRIDEIDFITENRSLSVDELEVRALEQSGQFIDAQSGQNFHA